LIKEVLGSSVFVSTVKVASARSGGSISQNCRYWRVLSRQG
jgi:hypothetical protein